MSKLDITDVYHRGIVKMLQMGALAYIIPLAPGDKGRIISVDGLT